MTKMESSRVKTTSEAYEAMRRIGERVRRANPKDQYESVSSVEHANVSRLEAADEFCLRLAYDVGQIQRCELPLHSPSLGVGHRSARQVSGAELSTFPRSLRLHEYRDRRTQIASRPMTSPAPVLLYINPS